MRSPFIRQRLARGLRMRNSVLGKFSMWESGTIGWHGAVGHPFLAVLISRLSIVKAVAGLDKDLPRVQIMRAAEREAVVEQNPPVRNIDTLHAQRESLAELLA